MDGLLERLPLVYGALAVVVALFPSVLTRRLGGAGLAVLALGAAADSVGGHGAPASFVTINEFLAGIGALVVLGAVIVAVRSGPRAPAPPPAPEAPPGHPGLDPLLLTGLIVAALSPHLIPVALGLCLGLVAAARGAVRAGRRRWLVLLTLGTGLCGVAVVLMLTILGPLGGQVSMLPAGPFSPPAERLLALLLLSGGLLLSGLPPLTRAPWRLTLAPFSGLLLVRVMMPGIPQGLADWQPLALLLLAGALITGALTRRWALVAVSGGLGALWSGDPGGIWAGWVLLGWGWVADQVQGSNLARGIALPPRWIGILFLPPALAALPALEAVLRAEVLLATLAAVGTAAGFGLGAVRPTTR